MLKTLRFGILIVLLALALPIITTAQTTKYKCMIQMTNYMGDGAYIVVSLVNKDNAYDKTLYV